MTGYHSLRGARRRRHHRLLRDVVSRGTLYVRSEHEFRMVERLHRVGLVTACASKWNWRGGRRPFRELAVFVTEAKARRQYDQILPRRGGR